MTSTIDVARTRALGLAKASRFAETGEGRDRRMRHGVPLRTAADAIGVAVATIWRWEHNRNRPRGAAALRWVDLLEELGS